MTRSLAPDDQSTVLAFGLLGTNVFGPQSQWSSLLTQREWGSPAPLGVPPVP
jgi:hypothetical protein